MSEKKNTNINSNKKKVSVPKSEVTEAKQRVIEKATELVQETNNVVGKPVSKREYKVKPTLDPNSLVTVKSGYHGKLLYKSKRTGEVFVWGGFGEEQDIELKELKAAKNSYKKFFENNWFLIDDPEVIEYLGVSKFYVNALNLDNFDELFKEPPEKIIEIIRKLSNGQKRTVTYRAKQLISDGLIDSIKTINALENALSIELIER